MSRRTPRLVLGASVLLVCALSVIFALELASLQRTSRREVSQRFGERAQAAAALTEAVFSTASVSARFVGAGALGAAHVSSQSMAAIAAEGHLAFTVLLDQKGKLIAASPATPAPARLMIAAMPGPIRQVLDGQPFALSDLLGTTPGRPVLEFVQPLSTPFGTRVLVNAINPPLIYLFLSSYLSQLPTIPGGRAFVLDAHGAVIGSPNPDVPQGRPVEEPGLIAALRRGDHGAIGGGRYFASSPIGHSSWRVVLSASSATLFASVSGTRKWLPWILLAAFGVIAAIALAFLRDLLGKTAGLSASNEALECHVKELAQSEERFRLLVDGATDYAIIMLDPGGLVVSWNRGAQRLKGYKPIQIVGQHHARFYVPDEARADKPAAALAAAARDGSYEGEGWRVRQDGTRFWANVVITPLHDDDGSLRGFCEVTRDVTERKAAEERLLHDAMHDSLTGLPNRPLFLDRLEQAMTHTERRANYRCAVLFLDLDRFKLVNDGFSHAAGDELLVTFARRLRAGLRPSDTLARFGGDEFTILLDDINSVAEATEVAGRVTKALEHPFRIGGRDLFVTASVGISLSEPGMNASDMIRNSDIAMYDAKRSGKARAAIFDDHMHSRVVTQFHLETDLRAAIEERRLDVVYQPIIELGSGRLSGFEALARWPVDGKQISPDEFIPVAEDTGLIRPLGRLVLEQACEQLASWRERGLVGENVAVSVNVSGHQLIEPQLITDVKSALTRSGLPPHALRLELTESTIINEPERMGDALKQLERAGVGVHLDDFGTGYSSLTFLHYFPGDTLKIDRSFIGSMHENQGSAEIVTAIVGLAHNLGLHTIAEGVENPAQLQKLRILGCEYAQGYLFAKPLQASQVQTFIETWDPHATSPPHAQPRR